jgi:hypothetical protein
MGSRYSRLLVALVAVLAISAVGAASALAAPEFEKPFPNKVEVKGPGVELATVGRGAMLLCSNSAKGTGEITGAKAATLKLTLSGCLSLGDPFFSSCSTAGAASGEVKLELEGSPVYTEKNHAVGLLLKHKGAGNLAEYTCGTTEKETVKVRGSMIGVLSFANVTTKQFRLALSEKKGVQEPTEYEGSSKATLEAEGSGAEAFAFEQAGYLSGSETGSHVNELTSSEATKIKASLTATRGLPEFRPESMGLASFEGSASVPKLVLKNGTATWSYNTATVKGNLISPKEVALTITFHEGSGVCGNGGGNMVSETLVGRLGYLNKTSKEVGLLLEPIGSAAAKCSGYPLGEQEWKGSVLGAISPVNTLSKTLKLTFKQTGGVQELEKFEGEEVLHHLSDYLRSTKEEDQMGLTASFELTGFPESVKIEA